MKAYVAVAEDSVCTGFDLIFGLREREDERGRGCRGSEGLWEDLRGSAHIMVIEEKAI